MHLVSVNVGQPQLVMREGKRYSTAINRKAVETGVPLESHGLAGDRQADAGNHGGVDKAICCFPNEHYQFFADRLEVEALKIPAFGENFTTSGLLEDQVCIGDQYDVGTAIVQVTQPRDPCWKLAQKHHCRELVRWVHDSKFTGFYMRVLQTGEVKAGDPVRLVERSLPDVTVAGIFAALHSKNTSPELVARFARLPQLSAAWRGRFAQRQD